MAPHSRFIAITGANGKSTTTALIAHVLREAGRDVQMGGNIGVPVLELAPPSEDAIHVVECSSFQIDLAPSLNPSVGALLNITPDHLDRHGTFENYAAIKERLVAKADVALIGVDDEPCRAIAERLRASEAANGRPRVDDDLRASARSADIAVEDRRIVAEGGANAFDLREAPALRGVHNGQNAAFAFAAARSDRAQRRGNRARHGVLRRPRASHGAGRPPRSRVSSSTIRKPPTPTPPKRRCCPSTIFSGSPAARRKRAASSRCARFFRAIAKAYLIGAATEEFARTLEDERRRSSVAGRLMSRPPPRRATRSQAPPRSRSCCCRRPAPPMTNSPISRNAAISFVRWSRN